MRFIVATGNKNKLREFQEIMPEYEFEAMQSDVPETGSTFAENAEIKARAVRAALGEDKNAVVIADDSGLCVDALDGAPGIYSARFMGEDTSYEIKNRSIIESVAKADTRGANFTCAMCAILPDGRAVHTEGKVIGEIAREPAGDNGFGYDPIFLIPELGLTTAQLAPDKKNEISHRGRALRAMAERLKKEMSQYTG